MTFICSKTNNLIVVLVVLRICFIRTHSHDSIIHNGDRQVGAEHVVSQGVSLDPKPVCVSHDLMDWGQLHLRGQASGPVSWLDAELHKVLLLIVEKMIDLHR